MKVLHVIGGLSRESGGPSRSAQGLVAAEYAAGIDAWLWPIVGGEPWIEGVRLFDCSEISTDRRSLCGAKSLEWCSIVRLKQFDLIHIHGIWDWKLHKVAVMCRKAGVPYVIAPRGTFAPWALKRKWLKKRIARWLYQDRDLKLAAAIHATAESEAEQFRRLGFKNKIIISPNGVNVPERTLEAKAKKKGEQRRALFVSRMNPVKGVLELVESWARVMNKLNVKGCKLKDAWQCELVYTVNGEEEKAYEQKVKQRILELGMTYVDNRTIDHHFSDFAPQSDLRSVEISEQSNNSSDFIFTGPLDDNAKWDAYARADLFILPSYTENFGIVVAEALWAGVPVITTKGTPWAELEERKCGWWVDLSALDSALREAIEHHSSDFASQSDLRSVDISNNPNNRTILQEMGARGRKLVDERYTWKAACGKMIDGYRCLDI